MNKTRNLVEMGEFYAATVLTEAKKNFPPKDTFKLATNKKPKAAEADKKAFISKPSGPAEASNYKSDIIDVKNNKTSKKNFYEPEKFSQTSEKIEVSTINNSMNKSIFDRLYEDVMSDNIQTPSDMEHADAEALDLPGHEEGEVTITLDRELAEKLHDVLMTVLGGEEHGEPDGDENKGEVESEDEETDDTLPEATELKEVPSTVPSMTKVGGKSNVVSSSWSSHNVDGQGGDGKIKDGIDAEGKDEGHALVGAGVKNGKPTPVTGKANVVDGRATKNVGKVAFTK